jgi:hypothetical protein
MSANFDITSLMAPYLDVHMVNPMLDFLREVLFYLLLQSILHDVFTNCESVFVCFYCHLA